MSATLNAPAVVTVNLKECFSQMRAQITTDYPALLTFTFNVTNLNTLFDQIIFASLDFIAGIKLNGGYDNAIDILLRNGLTLPDAQRFVTDNTHRVIRTIQSRFSFPITNSGLQYRAVYMRFNHLELARI